MDRDRRQILIIGIIAVLMCRDNCETACVDGDLNAAAERVKILAAPRYDSIAVRDDLAAELHRVCRYTARISRDAQFTHIRSMQFINMS